MTKFHVRENGELGVCEAEKNCPLGGDTPHGEFASKREAQVWVERINEAKAGGVFTRNEALVKKWAFRSFVNYDVAAGDADAKAILEGKIAEASTDDEINNVVTEIRELMYHRNANPELAAEMLSKIENPQILEKLELSRGGRFFRSEDMPIYTALYNHPQATYDMKENALTAVGMTYADKLAVTNGQPDANARLVIIASTNWKEEGRRNLVKEVDAVAVAIENNGVDKIDAIYAAALVKAAKDFDVDLPANDLVAKIDRSTVSLGNYTAIITYGVTNLEALKSDGLKNLTEIARDARDDEGIYAIHKGMDKLGKLTKISGYSDEEVRDLKDSYTKALAAAGGQIRPNFVSDEQAAAIKARDDYNKTAIPKLEAALAKATEIENKLFVSGKERNQARETIKELDYLLAGARRAHRYTEIMRSLK